MFSHNSFLNQWYLKVKVAQPCPTLCDPMDDIAHQAPLSMGFSRQEYWSVLPCPPPGYLTDLGTEPRSPALQSVFTI